MTLIIGEIDLFLEFDLAIKTRGYLSYLGAHRSEVTLFWGRFGFFYNLLSSRIISCFQE